MLLDEIFNHTEQLNWQLNGRFELAEFTVDNVKFQIQIDRKPLDAFADLKNKKTAEVSFFREDIQNHDDAHSTAGNSKKISVKVYGAVLNGLKDKFDNYDAFYFTAERKHSTNQEEFEAKNRIYFYMSDRIAKHFHTLVYFYEKETSAKTEYLVSKIKLSEQTKEDSGLKNALSEALKACGFNTKSIY